MSSWFISRSSAKSAATDLPLRLSGHCSKKSDIFSRYRFSRLLKCYQSLVSAIGTLRALRDILGKASRTIHNAAAGLYRGNEQLLRLQAFLPYDLFDQGFQLLLIPMIGKYIEFAATELLACKRFKFCIGTDRAPHRQRMVVYDQVAAESVTGPYRRNGREGSGDRGFKSGVFSFGEQLPVQAPELHGDGDGGNNNDRDCHPQNSRHVCADGHRKQKEQEKELQVTDDP